MVCESKKKKSDPGWPPIEADTIPKLLKLGAQEFADRIFMRQKDLGIWQRFTWKEVYENMGALGLGLLKLGLKRGETVAVAGENRKELFWSGYAALAVGGKVAHLYPGMASPEIKEILEHSESIYLVAQDQEQVDKVLEVKSQIPSLKKIIYWDSKGMWRYNNPLLMEFKEVQEEGTGYGRQHPRLFEEAINQGKGSDIAVLSYGLASRNTRPSNGVRLTYNDLFDYSHRVKKHCSLKPFAQYLSHLSPARGSELIFGITLGVSVPFILNFAEKTETVQPNIRELGVEVLILESSQWEGLASMVRGYLADSGAIRRFLCGMGMAIGNKTAGRVTEGREIHPIWSILHPMADRLILRAIRDNLGLKKVLLAISEGPAVAPEVLRFFHDLGVRLRSEYGLPEAGMLALQGGEKFGPDVRAG